MPKRSHMSVVGGIVLKKSFLGDERNFLGPLIRFARGDVRVHVSHKNDHGPSYRRYRALQRSRRLRINSREIFDVVRFSTFATVSVEERKSLPTVKMTALDDPQRTLPKLSAPAREAQYMPRRHRHTTMGDLRELPISETKGRNRWRRSPGCAESTPARRDRPSFRRRPSSPAEFSMNRRGSMGFSPLANTSAASE
jgi:hypothetical protein